MSYPNYPVPAGPSGPSTLRKLWIAWCIMWAVLWAISLLFGNLCALLLIPLSLFAIGIPIK
jgi:hypothetical protein